MNLRNRPSAQASYCIRSDYESNPPRNAIEADQTPGEYWTPKRLRTSQRYQFDVYHYARDLAAQVGAHIITDIGCGPATKLNSFFDSRYRLIGIDSVEGVALCQQLNNRGEYHAIDLDSPDAILTGSIPRADLVICADVIEHLEHPETLLRLCREGATPGAQVVLSTPCRERLLGTEAVRPSNPEHVREWSSVELRRLVEEHHFTVIDQRWFRPFRFLPDLMTASYLLNRVVHRLPAATTHVLTLTAS